MFEKEPFGALERLVTQKLLDVAQRVTKEELHDEEWLRLVARLSHRTYEQMRVVALDFLETDIFNLSVEYCGTFLDPLIDSWEIDLATFAMEIVLNGRLASAHLKRFEFVERDPIATVREEPGLSAFLDDPSLSGNATAEEIAFLRALRFTNSRPTPLYYYRELQSLRDPLHFHRAAADTAAGDESFTERDATGLGWKRTDMPDRSALNVDYGLEGSRWASERWSSTAAIRGSRTRTLEVDRGDASSVGRGS